MDGLTEEEKSQVILAFNFWKEASGGIIDYRITDYQDNISPGYNDIFFLKEMSSNPNILALYFRQSKSIKIMANNINSRELFRNTVIHELGHYFGLGHSEDSDSYMFFAIDKKTAYLSNIDKEKFCKNICCK